MIRLLFTLLLIHGGFGLFAPASAQKLPVTIDPVSADNDTLTTVEGRRLDLIVDYLNPVNYRARTFGVRQWGLHPTLRYTTRDGWSTFVTGYIWTDSQQTRWAKTDLGIEKEGQIGKYWNYSIGYERWFFEGDLEDRTSLTNFTGLTVSRELGDWTATGGVYYMFGTDQLLQNDLLLSRRIDLLENRHMAIRLEPGGRAVLANQSSDFAAVIGLVGKKPTVLKPAGTSHTFGLVDLEIDVALTIQTPRWTLILDPHIAKPLNTLEGESSKAFFYLSASLVRTLKL